LALRFALFSLLAACSLRDPPAPATPAAPPLPADPPVTLGTMMAECDGLLAALTAWRTCENLEDNDARDVDAWLETATRSYAASKQANPEPNAQGAIAKACHRAAQSVRAAHERCNNGKKPIE
jgi:hypothetical protein